MSFLFIQTKILANVKSGLGLADLQKLDDPEN